MVAFTNFKLLLPDWRGYIIAVFCPGVDSQPVHEPASPDTGGYKGGEYKIEDRGEGIEQRGQALTIPVIWPNICWGD